MRRLLRIQRLRAIQQIFAQSHIQTRISARCLSTTSSRCFQNTRTRLLPDEAKKKRREIMEALERDRQSALELQENSRISEEDAWEDVDLAETTRIAIPSEFTYALPPRQVNDYIPATSADELEAVGGLSDWWDQDGNWGEADRLHVFAGEKVADDVVKRVLLRQAVVECLAVMGNQGQEFLGGRWAFDRESILRSAGVQVEIGANGDVTLKGDLDALLKGLNPLEEETLETKDTSEGQVTEDDTNTKDADILNGTPEVAVDQVDVEEAFTEQEGPVKLGILSPDEAREMVASHSPEWTRVPLTNPQLKFAVHKRFYQLTGHYIPDAKLAPTKTTQHLLDVICQPPKAKKLVDEIERRDKLLNLPNVKVYNRRVTPIDKEIWAGRWKVIEGELQKRDLPITGEGKYGKHREKYWLMGKP